MKKFLVGMGIFLVILWVINFNNGKNLRQIESAADISCATFKAWEKYGMTSEDARRAVQDAVLSVIQKYKLSGAEYLKIKERLQNDLSFKNEVACLMQKKAVKRQT